MQARSHAEPTPLSIVFGGKASWPLPRAVPALESRAVGEPGRSPESTEQVGTPTEREQALLKELGTTLRRRRTQRGLSLERLSAASTVSRSMLSRVERGESAPSILTLVQIARALNVELAVLLPAAIQHPNT